MVKSGTFSFHCNSKEEEWKVFPLDSFSPFFFVSPANVFHPVSGRVSVQKIDSISNDLIGFCFDVSERVFFFAFLLFRFFVLLEPISTRFFFNGRGGGVSSSFSARFSLFFRFFRFYLLPRPLPVDK